MSAVQDQDGEATQERPSRLRFMIHRRNTSDTPLHGPELMVFTLGLAAMMSLFFLVYDVLARGETRPTTVVVFVIAGSYCFVLIRRQRAMIRAEQAFMRDIEQATVEQPAARILDKDERRQVLSYFEYSPPEAKEHGAVTAANTPGDSNVPAARESRGASQTESDRAKPPKHHRTASSLNITFDLTSLHGMDESKVADPDTSSRDAENQTSPSMPRTQGIRVGATQLETSIGGTDRGDTAQGDVSQTVLRQGGVDDNSAAAATIANGGQDSRIEAPDDCGRGESGEWSTASSCIVCFGEYAYGDTLCRLPCRHVYHAQCIDEWLDGANHAWCPLCKKDLLYTGDRIMSNHRQRIVSPVRNAPDSRIETPAVAGLGIEAV